MSNPVQPEIRFIPISTNEITIMACMDQCPQELLRTETVALRACQSCAECLAVCQTGREYDKWK